MDTSSVPPIKLCRKCGEAKPATTEFFSKSTKDSDGLQDRCKACNKAYRQANKEKLMEYGRQYRATEEHIEKTREYGYEYRSKNREIMKEKRDANREVIAARGRSYHQRNADKVRARRLKTRARELDQSRNYYRQNKERVSERVRIYRLNNPERYRVIGQRSRARRRFLPDTLTQKQWQRAIEYFKGRCAICGRQLKDLFGTHTIGADHWIPVTSPDCLGTVAENMVPLCHGVGGCNNSKSAKKAEVWLRERYGKQKSEKILERIRAYFEWALMQE